MIQELNNLDLYQQLIQVNNCEEGANQSHLARSSEYSHGKCWATIASKYINTKITIEMTSADTQLDGIG
jgi:hypothetical protein